MNIDELTIMNRLSVEKVKEFRQERASDKKARIDEHFHQYKNRYPYFGFIEVEVFGNTFLMFSGNDDLIAMTFHWFGASMYEPMSMRTWVERSKTAQHIYDIGSFSGVYSLSAASANAKCDVHAFEAVRRTYARLLMNIQVNKLNRRITAINRAVADKTGEVTFYQFRGENILGNGASMIEKNIPATSSDEKVSTQGLDEYILGGAPEPDLMKIDVEGAENLVLEGMRDMLAQHKPQMLIEVTPDTAQQVNETLRSHGYKVSAVNEAAMKLVPFEGACKGVMNLLAE